MINEQTITTIVRTVCAVVVLWRSRKHPNLGLSMLMYSVFTDILGVGVWFKWWVYLLLSLFSIVKKTNLNVTHSANNIEKLYTVEVWRFNRNDAHHGIVGVRLFGSRKEAYDYCSEQESYNEDFYTKAYVYEHRIKNNVD